MCRRPPYPAFAGGRTGRSSSRPTAAYPSAIDLALLHGFAASTFTWRHVLDGLAVAHAVFPLDRPWAPLPNQVDATLAALDAHHLARPVLVGHSAGAEVAMATAVRARHRVAALVLLAPVTGRGAPAALRTLARLPGSARLAAPLLRAGSHLVGRGLRRAWYDRTKLTLDVVEGYRQPLLRPGVAESMWEMTATSHRGDEVRRQFHTISCPTLLIVGDHDRWATPLAVPRAELVVLEHCGHLPQEEQPERTVAEILRFLEWC